MRAITPTPPQVPPCVASDFRTRAPTPVASARRPFRVDPPGMRHLEILLDASGSMASMNAAAYDGVRELLEEMDEDSTVRLTTFNARVTHGREVQKAEAQASFSPGFCGGSTALHDGITSTLRTALEAHAEERVTVAIVTDGFENASVSSGIEDVRSEIRRAHDRNWRVVFLGANQDAIVTARAFGIAAARAMTYTGGPELLRACRAVSASARRFANGEDEAFTAHERAESAGADPIGAPVEAWQWLSVDPRSGEIHPYDREVSARLEEALARGPPQQVAVPAFAATVFLCASGSHVQKTHGGQRDVRRVTAGSSVHVAMRGAEHRIVEAGGREVTPPAAPLSLRHDGDASSAR